MVANGINIGEPPYQIIAKRLPLDTTVGVAGHLYLQVTDAKGLVAQFDGLAINPKNDSSLPFVGTPADKIKAHVQNIPVWKNSEQHESTVVYSTSNPQEIHDAIKSMQAEAEKINAKNADYGLFTSNSNAVFSRLITAASSVTPINPQNIEKAKNLGSINPGVDTEIVSSEQSPFWAKTVKAIVETGTFLWETVTSAVGSVVAWAGDTLFPKSNDEKIAQTPQTSETQNNLQPVSNSSTLQYKAGQQLYGYVPVETPHNITSQGQKIG